jgi:chromosome partitioning protein
VRRNLNPELRVRGIVLTMFDGRTNLARDVEVEVRKHFDNTFRAVIPRSVRLSEAPSHGLPIQRYDPRSAGAEAYEQLADELLEQLALPVAEASSGG